MKLFNVIKKFFYDSFTKRDINDRIRSIMQKYDEVVIPLIPKVETAFLGKPPVSDYAVKFLADFNQTLPSNLRKVGLTSYITISLRSIKNARELLTLLEGKVNNELPDVLYVDGITYQKATILRLIELLDFTADYASRQLCYYVASESNAIALGKSKSELPYTKAEEVAILTYQNSYFKTLELFHQPPKNILQTLSRIPEVMLSGDEKADLPSARASDLDPLTLGVIPMVSSLFLWAGEIQVDREIARYERAKKERRDVEMRIEVLKQHQSGQVDARTESILNGYTRELTLLRDKIETLERKAR